MKKTVKTVLLCFLLFALSGCGFRESYDVKIVVPAGSQEEYVYSQEEISPSRNTVVFSSGDGLGDTAIVLKRVEGQGKDTYGPEYLTPGMSVEMTAQQGTWFKVGVSVQNPTDEDMIVYVHVEGASLRIE